MFEAAELGRKITKDEFNAVAEDLRTELVELQQALRACDFPVIIVFAGVDGAGKSEAVNLVNEWMDPRWIVTRAYPPPSDEERERPEFWRYWRDLPPKGQIGQFLSAWYSEPLQLRAYGRIGKARFDAKLEHIQHFERMLTEDGALILKFWMHLNKAGQKQRLKKLEKDPERHWKITKKDWANWKRYDKFMDAAERIIMRTSTGGAPWQIVEGAQSRYRSLTVLQSIRDRIRKHMAEREAEKAALKKSRRKRTKPNTAQCAAERITILSSLDLTKEAGAKTYARELRSLQGRLHQLHGKAETKGISTMMVFEGADAAGKGGSIRRIVSALDARDVRVLPFSAPSEEERAQHYLWRFWRHVPRAGRVTIFDRSWYGRVLVERVEGFAREEEWRRAYAEINEFESQLASHGIIVMKYWLQIDKDEQEARFNRRAEIPYKRWKLTDEDWRNREKWDDYQDAINEMIERTSTVVAPWTLIEANDKKFARLKVIRELCERMDERLG